MLKMLKPWRSRLMKVCINTAIGLEFPSPTSSLSLICLWILFFLFFVIFPERSKLADPFYRLEHQEEDLKKKKEAEPVLVRLQRVSDARHSDDYALNKALRAKLRVPIPVNPIQLCSFFFFPLNWFLSSVKSHFLNFCRGKRKE